MDEPFARPVDPVTESIVSEMMEKGGVRKAFLGDAAFFSALELILFLPALWRGEIPFFMDTLAQFYPLRYHAANLLHSGQLPLWNRTMFCGVPLLANPQWGLLYPLNWPFLAMPGPFWFTFSYPLHFVIGAMGAYALVIKLARSRIGAWAAAMAFLFNTMTVSRIAFGAYHLCLAWVPWAWVMLIGIGEKGRRTKSLAILSILIALQLLSGAPQVAFYASLSYGVIAIVPQAGENWHAAPRRLGFLIAATMLGLLLAAPQLIPTWKFVQICDRGDGLTLSQVQAGTLSLFGWIKSLVGGAGFPEDPESTACAGGIGFLLVCYAVLLRWRLVAPFLIVIVLAIAYAHPDTAPLFYHFTPLYSSFHDPKRVLAIVAITMAVMAGIGLASLLDYGKTVTKLSARVLAIIALALAVPSLIVVTGALREHPPLSPALGWIRLPIGESDLRFAIAASVPAVALLIAFISMCKTRRPGVWMAAALLAFGGSAAYYSLTEVDLKMTAASDYFDEFMRDKYPRDGRFFAFDTFGRYTAGRGIYSYDYPAMADRLFPNAAAFYGLEDAQGYDAFKLKPYAEMIRAANRDSVLLYESHFGLLTDPASPVVPNLGVVYAAGPADSMFALPGGATAETSETFVTFVPVQRVERLDRPATGTLNLVVRPHEESEVLAKVAFADSSSYPLRFYEKDGLLIGEWSGMIPPGGSAPVVRYAGGIVVDYSYKERTDESISPFSGEVVIAGERWLNYRQTEPLVSLPEGRILDAVFEANRVAVMFDAAEDGAMLVVRDAFAPGWRAEVDGAEVPIRLAEGMFRAVAVPAGEHRVVMRYWPPGLTLGLLLFLAGAAMLFGLYIAGRKMRH